ncbi:MAG: hypothetical protein AVDCRST_MAG64-1115 [uncultured Phycisphaerae bacterium]|uniref:Thioredoxin domain-containing protein n=1 Tax=uncultured Phycisphaerae bacterium TaxID=904963 RepID=A0A6J4NGR0_9BACT|nr:MAG: hypothetical protein AVDCRST_MAG64-1115 [uncultured Phycisphaerae bacterium]
MKRSFVLGALTGVLVILVFLATRGRGTPEAASPVPTAAAAAPAVAWRTDLAAATAEARAAGKDVLVEFTVAGGAAPAAMLDLSVYDRPEFLQRVHDRFVPVRLTVRTDAAGAQNGNGRIVALAERLGVARIPSLVLMDADGRPYAAVETEEDEAATVDAQLKEIEAAITNRVERDAAFTRASESPGADRARHLDAALRRVGRFALPWYEPVVTEIVAVDADNTMRLRERYDTQLHAERLDRLVQEKVYPLIDLADFTAAAAALDEIVAAEKPPLAQEQTLIAFKGQLFHSMGRADEARRTLEKAYAMAPESDSGKRILAAIEQLTE